MECHVEKYPHTFLASEIYRSFMEPRVLTLMAEVFCRNIKEVIERLLHIVSEMHVGGKFSSDNQ